MENFVTRQSGETGRIASCQAMAVDPARIVESCGAAIIGLSLDGTIVSWNGRAERLYGYRADATIGHSVLILAPPNRPADLEETLESIQSGNAVEAGESLHVRQDGSFVEVLLTLSAIPGPEGTVAGVSLVAQDITKNKREENERLDLINELTHALGRMNRWAAQPSTKH